MSPPSETKTPRRPRLPSWLNQKVPTGSAYFGIADMLSKENIHTVCQEAKCPNRTECWARGTLTFQILGDTCTRACGFCAEKRGRPNPPDPNEPQRIASAAKRLQLKHVVVTSPARDDLPDGGASHFAKTISALRLEIPQVTVETLVPDFQENRESLEIVFQEKPDVFNHNLETVKRLTPRVRARATYERSLRVLLRAAQHNLRTKSGIMVGLGETRDEIYSTFCDMRKAQISYLTVGQYLPPSSKHLPLERFYTPREFEEMKQDALSLGFIKASVGPFVRSSYHADEMI